MDTKKIENDSLLTGLGLIETFVFDMDGVLTDGSLLVLDEDAASGKPNWYRKMNVKDGYALQLAAKSGYNIIVISGSGSPAVADRLKRLQVHEVHFHVHDKKTFLEKLLNDKGLTPESTLFMGDDIPDEPAMRLCRMAACPWDAAAEIKAIADYISPLRGGEGCVRDVISKVMKLQGKWNRQAEVPST